MDREMAQNNGTKILQKIIGLIIALGVVLVAFYIITIFLHITQISFYKYIEAALIGVVVYLIFRIIRGFLERYLSKYADRSKVHPIMFFVSLLGYFIIGLAILASLGIDVSSVILGGSLVSVIIGLASQTVLANQFAGIMLTIVRPFKIGDYVTLNMWQYGGAFPVIYPKYFSVDRIESTAYSGEVVDLTINYTSLKMDSGDIVKIPNGILIQGAIIVRKDSIRVKARYEVPKYIDFDLIREKIRAAVAKMPDVREDVSVTVDETTLNTYLVMVVASFNSIDADAKRSDILRLIMSQVEPLKLGQ